MVESSDLAKLNLPLLENFSSQEVAFLETEIYHPRFEGVIDRSIVDQLQKLSSLSDTAEFLGKLLPLACGYSRAATSGLQVGAVAVGNSGSLYLGANLEIPGECLGNSIHAEQSAVNNALLHGERGITHLAVSHAPCGHCRQFLNEISNAESLQIIVSGLPTTTLKSLLPVSFGPSDLGSRYPLFKPSPENRRINQQLSECLPKDVKLSQTHSYAPHTGALSLVSLEVGRTLVVGNYIENAAYNPSLSPLLSALDRFRFKKIADRNGPNRFGGDRGETHVDFKQINSALLIELEGAVFSQQTHVSSLLSVLAPTAEFTTITVPS